MDSFPSITDEVARGDVSVASASGASILIVDDTRTNLRFLTEVLSKYGYTVRPVPDGRLALSSAQADPPDLVLLDIMMPHLNGYEVCERLKADERTRDIPVIFLSALSDVADKVRAFSVGGVDYITKPFQMPEVLARVRTHLTLKQLRENFQMRNVQLQHEVINHRRTENTLRHYAERLRLLHEIDQSILAARSAETTAVAAAGRIRQLIPCQRVLVLTMNESEQIRTLAAESSGEVSLKIAMEIYQDIFSDPSLNAGRVHGVEDLAALSQRSPMQEALYERGVHSYMVVPLFSRTDISDPPGVSSPSGLLGTLHLEANYPRAFDADHITLAVQVSVLLAVAIRQGRLYALARQEIADREQAEAALRQQALELEARNAELDAFAHMVAHDLKNPLTALVGFSYLLQKRYAQMSEQELGYNLGLVGQNALKMVSIIDELLLLASVRKEEVETGPLDMYTIVSEVLGRLSNMITDTQAEIIMPAVAGTPTVAGMPTAAGTPTTAGAPPTNDVSSEAETTAWPSVIGYAPWIEEVWMNYISNALKYGGRPDEGVAPIVALGFDIGQPSSANCQTGESQVRFWVRDNGLGLTEEEQEQLFTPFTRLDPTRAMGHGLGLSIVRRIVEKLGGEVGVESDVGRGSKFYFTLKKE
jgi:signal transduction histidine kinase